MPKIQFKDIAVLLILVLLVLGITQNQAEAGIVHIDDNTNYLEATLPHISADVILNDWVPALVDGTALEATNSSQLLQGHNKRIARKIVVPISAYNSVPEQTDDSPFITANNEHVYFGGAAANFLPFGTEFRIPGYFDNKVFRINDRMNKRYDYRIDLWMQEIPDARQWGVRNVTIEILES